MQEEPHKTTNMHESSRAFYRCGNPTHVINIAGMRLRYLQQADSPRLLRMSEVERENASAACRSAVEFQTGCEQHSGAVPHFCKKAVMERRGIVTR